MKNRICKALNIENNIIQGPMAWISTAPLVAAVSEAGGLGVLGVGFAPPDFIRSQIRETKAMTSKPFGANVILIPDMLKVVTPVVNEEKPAVIYADTLGELNLDFAKKYFDMWHENGMKVVSKVACVQDAVTAEKAGADVIIVKGWEGGGHVTHLSTLTLLPQALDAVKSAPVVASGGIGDGRGMAAMLLMGADGIELGTAFMLAEECPIHPNVKEAMIAAKDMDTIVVGNCTGEPCRQLKNKLSDKICCIEAEYVKTEAAVKLREVAESSLKKAMLEGDVDEEGAVMAGQIVGLLKNVKPARTIVEEILAGCRTTLDSASHLQ